MKKNSFLEGAFIATFAIFFTKFLGIIYVIPFYKIVGNGNVELDVGINYNDYIGKEYKVIPVGENGLIDQVMEDFYE